MKISILKDLGTFDIGNKFNVQNVCNKLVIQDNNVVLDISRCIIDYPSTSQLLDKVLIDLTKLDGSKSLTIITNLSILELLLLHWLFIGSEFFEIKDETKNLSPDDFVKIISEKLKSEDMKMNIQIVNKQGNTDKDYKYGY